MDEAGSWVQQPEPPHHHWTLCACMQAGEDTKGEKQEPRILDSGSSFKWEDMDGVDSESTEPRKRKRGRIWVISV